MDAPSPYQQQAAMGQVVEEPRGDGHTGCLGDAECGDGCLSGLHRLAGAVLRLTEAFSPELAIPESHSPKVGRVGKDDFDGLTALGVERMVDHRRRQREID